MATNPATPDDVASRWRPLTDAELVVAATLLDDAWALLKHRDATIDTRLDADPVELDAGLVRMVLVSMVLRVLRNPDGIRQESIQDYSYTRDSDAGSGLLTVTDAELDLLAASSAGSGGAFTIRPAYQVPVGRAAAFDADAWEWAP